MQRRRTHRLSSLGALTALTILAIVTPGLSTPASAQVIIDMPRPRPAPRTVTPPPPAPADAAAPAVVLDAPAPPRVGPQPGALAFQQYASTRYLPEDPYGFRRFRRPFTPGDFTASFSKWGLHAPFHVITPTTVIVVQPPLLIKPPFFGK